MRSIAPTLLALITLTAAALPGQAKKAGNGLIITEVLVDNSVAPRVITIKGQEFVGKNSGATQVRLGGLVGFQLVLTSVTATEIVAKLPASVPPGTYDLIVTDGPGFSKYDSIDLAVGAVGGGAELKAPVTLTHDGVPMTVRSENAKLGEGIGLDASATFIPSGPFDGRPADTIGVRATAYSWTEGGAHATGLAAHGETTVGGGSGDAFGVRATACDAQSGSGRTGVHGTAFGEPGIGVRGTTTGTIGSFGVLSEGGLGCTGSKAFLQPDPKDASRVIKFVCLEGNESGTYFRGRGRLVNGVAEIAIPEEWKLVTEDEGITVQVTPTGIPAILYVAWQSRERIVVRGYPDCAFNYFVNGVRRGFASHQPYLENRFFKPDVRGIPYGSQYPEALRQLLVKNGILNPDYTPNEQTAARLGWQLKNPDEVRIEERWWLTSAERVDLLVQRQNTLRRRSLRQPAGSQQVWRRNLRQPAGSHQDR